MKKSVIITSKVPNGLYTKQLEDYLLKHFSGISVQKEGWKDIESIGSENLVIAQYFPGRVKESGSSIYEFEKRAKEASSNNIVFILQPWGRYSHSDIPEGLAGVIYRLDNGDFEGFAPDGKVQPAHELLQKYF